MSFKSHVSHGLSNLLQIQLLMSMGLVLSFPAISLMGYHFHISWVEISPDTVRVKGPIAHIAGPTWILYPSTPP